MSENHATRADAYAQIEHAQASEEAAYKASLARGAVKYPEADQERSRIHAEMAEVRRKAHAIRSKYPGEKKRVPFNPKDMDLQDRADLALLDARLKGLEFQLREITNG